MLEKYCHLEYISHETDMKNIENRTFIYTSQKKFYQKKHNWVKEIVPTNKFVLAKIITHYKTCKVQKNITIPMSSLQILIKFFFL